MINRNGAHVPVRGRTVLQAGDEVLLLTDAEIETDPQPLFTPPYREP